jgi:hypothetical protein
MRNFNDLDGNGSSHLTGQNHNGAKQGFLEAGQNGNGHAEPAAGSSYEDYLKRLGQDGNVQHPEPPCSETEPDHGTNGNGESATPKPWKNKNVLYIAKELDTAENPYRAMRIGWHLQRRVGKRTAENKNINPGIESIAEVCRMNKNVVERELHWLEAHGWITIDRSRFSNRYKVLVPHNKLYIDHRLDDYRDKDGRRLSAVHIRVLAHMSRLSDELGFFFIYEEAFARACGMHVRTIGKALDDLGEEKMCFYSADSYRKNPRYFLELTERFPRPRPAEAAQNVIYYALLGESNKRGNPF